MCDLHLTLLIYGLFVIHVWEIIDFFILISWELVFNKDYFEREKHLMRDKVKCSQWK
jgi:hypothetical protein